jgi:hypothetical protein
LRSIQEQEKLTNRNFAFAEESNDEEDEEPILYFNILGNRLCIAKATLLQFTSNYPESLLHVRFASGRWKDQTATDVDKEGNAYISNAPWLVFKPFLEAIRWTYSPLSRTIDFNTPPASSSLSASVDDANSDVSKVIYVRIEKRFEQAFKTMIDYFGIPESALNLQLT